MTTHSRPVRGCGSSTLSTCSAVVDSASRTGGWDTIDNIAVAIKEYMPFDHAEREPNGDVCPKHEQEKHYDWGLSEFLKEARMLAGFSHPSIVQVRQFFEDYGTAYIVMEYIDGQTLHALYAEEGTLSEDRLRALLAPILAGLQQVHDADWLHRDIKPGNIMLRDARTPVLIDFGAAQAATAGHGREERVVTPGFSPLEQYGRGGRRDGPWTDLYAVGAVLYRGMTGFVPSDALAREERDDLEAVQTLAKRSYGTQLNSAVDWALKLHAEERPQSIDEWARCPGPTRCTAAASAAPLVLASVAPGARHGRDADRCGDRPVVS